MSVSDALITMQVYIGVSLPFEHQQTYRETQADLHARGPDIHLPQKNGGVAS